MRVCSSLVVCFGFCWVSELILVWWCLRLICVGFGLGFGFGLGVVFRKVSGVVGVWLIVVVGVLVLSVEIVGGCLLNSWLNLLLGLLWCWVWRMSVMRVVSRGMVIVVVMMIVFNSMVWCLVVLVFFVVWSVVWVVLVLVWLKFMSLIVMVLLWLVLMLVVVFIRLFSCVVLRLFVVFVLMVIDIDWCSIDFVGVEVFCVFLFIVLVFDFLVDLNVLLLLVEGMVMLLGLSILVFEFELFWVLLWVCFDSGGVFLVGV